MKPLPNFAPYFEAPPLDLSLGKYLPADDKTYFALPALNAGLLKEPTQAEMLHHLREDDTDHFATEAKAEAFTLGSMVHALFLELWKLQGDEWKNHFVEVNTKGLATVAARELREANPGKLIVTAELFERALAIRQLAWTQNPMVRQYLGCAGLSEVIGHCWDDQNMIWRKWKPDFVPFENGRFGRYIADVKTTRMPLTEKSWTSECWKFGYFLQAAWYLDCHEMLTGHRPESFVWVVVSTSEPYMSRAFVLYNRPTSDNLYSQSTLAKARQSLGLDNTGGVSRIMKFCEAARATAAAQLDGEALSTETLRSIWEGYESEDEPVEIF